MQRTVNEVLFGYVDPVLAAALPFFPSIFGPLVNSQEMDWLVNRYGGLAIDTKFTGKDDINKAGAWQATSGYSSITSVNDIPSKNFSQPCDPLGFPRFGYDANCKLWDSTEYVTGSFDGLSSPPFVNAKSPPPIYVWVPQVERQVKLVAGSSVSVKGVNCNRYFLEDTQQLNNSALATNYYATKAPSYFSPMTTYYGGVDVYVTLPNFLNADPAYIGRLNDSSTVIPNPDLHTTYIDVEPITGKTMSARKRLQVTINLNNARLHNHRFNPFYNVFKTHTPLGNELFVPILWGQEYGDVSDSAASAFSTIYMYQAVAFGLRVGCFVAGFPLLFLSCFCCVYHYRKKDNPTTST